MVAPNLGGRLVTQTHRTLQSTLLLLAVCIALPCAAAAQSQTPAPRTVGPGPHTVTVESYRSLVTHTAYHPTDLGLWGAAKRIPIVSWGNGACARNGIAFAAFLTQIASHGYLAIAVGPRVVPSGPAPEPIIDDQLLLDAIDWAIRENSDASSSFFNRLDTAKIAV